MASDYQPTYLLLYEYRYSFPCFKLCCRNETEVDDLERLDCEPCSDDRVPEMPDCECSVAVFEWNQNQTNSSGTAAAVQTGKQSNETGSLSSTNREASKSPTNFTIFASNLDNLFMPRPVISETETYSVQGNATEHDDNVPLPVEPPAALTQNGAVDDELQDVSTDGSSIPEIASNTILSEAPLNVSLPNPNLGDDLPPMPGLQLHTAPADVTDGPDGDKDPRIGAGFENRTISIPETGSTDITSLPEAEPSAGFNVTSDMPPVVDESNNTAAPETAVISDETPEGPLGADAMVKPPALPALYISCHWINDRTADFLMLLPLLVFVLYRLLLPL